jgi:hypothetical protein
VAQAVSRRPGTAEILVRPPATLCEGFVLNTVALEQVSLPALRLSPFIIIPLLPHTLPLVCYRRYLSNWKRRQISVPGIPENGEKYIKQVIVIQAYWRQNWKYIKMMCAAGIMSASFIGSYIAGAITPAAPCWSYKHTGYSSSLVCECTRIYYTAERSCSSRGIEKHFLPV